MRHLALDGDLAKAEPNTLRFRLLGAPARHVTHARTRTLKIPPGCAWAANVKRWRDGTMALRWCAAGIIEAGKQFRRVNGHLHLPVLRSALEAQFAETVGPVMHDEDVNAA